MTQTFWKVFITSALLLAGVSTLPTASAGDPNEIAVEGVTLRFFLEANRTGTAVARECGGCDPIRLIVTPEMMIHIDGNPNNVMQWDANLNLGTQRADILYLPGDKRLVKVFLH